MKPRYPLLMKPKAAKLFLASELSRTGLSRAQYYQTVYLHSDHWKSLRAIVMDNGGYACCQCPATWGLQAHHKCYKSFFDVKPGSLIVLCGNCHANLHADSRLRRLSKKQKVPSALSEKAKARRQRQHLQRA